MSFQLMGAYLDHLCNMFTTNIYTVRQLPMLQLKNVLGGVYRVDPKRMSSALFMSEVINTNYHS